METITWENLGTPLGLGFAVAVVITLLFKPLLDFVLGYIIIQDVEQRDRLRGLIVNLVSMGLAYGLAAWRVSAAQDALPLALSAFLASLGEYEVLKNVLGTAKVRLPSSFFGSPE